QGRPSATSLQVKSNSLRQTKSIAGASFKLFSASTATLAPIRPALSLGLAAFSASTHFTSLLKEGTEGWTTTRAKSLAWGTASFRPIPAGGASISLEPGTSAAGWASQVGNQNERISRFAW